MGIVEEISYMVSKNPSHWKNWKERRDENPARYLWKLARRRAKELSLPFTIAETDISVPEFCPVFNVPLKFGIARACANSPSIDRFKPELGYVPGNICVISYRANELKRNSTVDELQKLIQWMLGIRNITPATKFLDVPEGVKRPHGQGRIYKNKLSPFWYIQYQSRGQQIRESTKSQDYQFAQKLLESRIGLSSSNGANAHG